MLNCAGNIANQATEVKMTLHIRFVELCTTFTAEVKADNKFHATNLMAVCYVKLKATIIVAKEDLC